MFDDDDSPFLTIPETAELLRVKPRTLDNLRWTRKGPPARRHGGRIVYHRREVLDWSERHRTSMPAKLAGNAPPRPDGSARNRPSGNRRPASRPSPPRVERKR
jgi:helix-turn-helix protein